MRARQISWLATMHRVMFLGGALPAMLLAAGCGGGAEPAAEEGGKETVKTESAKPAKSDGGSKKLSAADVKRKFLEDIPYDVFIDSPLDVVAIATPTGTSGGMPVAANNDPAPTPGGGTPVTTSTPPAASGAADWSELIAPEVLSDKISKINNTLTASLQTVGSFNTSYLAIPPDAATLAALAHVASEHPGSINWKENAKYVMAYSSEMAKAATMSGKKNLDTAKLAFDNIGVILAGSKPATLPEVPDTPDVAEYADFKDLMKQFELTEKLLTTTVNSEATLKEKKEEVIREASVLGTLSQVLTLEGYGFADDDDFKKFANAMIEAAQNMKTGADSANFDSYDKGLSIMRKACTDCHGQFRG